ncbi:craniofacial development protein 2-like [Plakobranchus ocellatus]|uniref:Craniofacial development protein 2-like n=1 Tax=Plakobranchus ocellatus TaxID=259542 RepID=A0AAV4DWZ1_9GAST|nr:craniofacial development protein 2-like [Plakobranchus ocellatus]
MIAFTLRSNQFRMNSYWAWNEVPKSSLSQVRWKGAGKITSGGHEIIYSGGTESEKGVGIIVDQTVTKAIKGYWALSDRVLLVKIAGKSVDLNIIQVYAPTANSNDEDLDKFYNELDTGTAKTQCKSQDPLIIMGDFNAKVDDIVGKHGLGIRNERGKIREHDRGILFMTCSWHKEDNYVQHVKEV